jgi:SAM-dependent methyltransferase
MHEPRTYVLGTDVTERARLLRQAAAFVPMSTWLLDQIGVGPGWRAIDVGCGPIGIVDLLAVRVGPGGAVVGLEREEHLLQMARAVVAERELSNVQLIAGDATASGLPPGTFDLAHERYVLIVSPEPERIVAEMTALVRPGGIVALEDGHTDSGIWYPPHPGRDRFWSVVQGVYRARGLDPDIGSRLPSLLTAAGLLDVQVHAQTIVQVGAEAYRGLEALFAGVRADGITRGLISDAEATTLLDSLRRHFDTPGALSTRPLVFQAWGRKPAD